MVCVLRAVLIGGKLMPAGGGGEYDVTSELTSWSAMVLPDEFPRPGKLLYFSAFFVASTPVYLQIWRPVNGSNDLMLVHSQKVFPRTVNQVETVSTDVHVNYFFIKKTLLVCDRNGVRSVKL